MNTVTHAEPPTPSHNSVNGEDGRLLTICPINSTIWNRKDHDEQHPACLVMKVGLDAASKRIVDEERVGTNERGGMGTVLDVRYDLLPPAALDAVAQIRKFGAEKYAPWNYTKVDAREHINHAIKHLFTALEDNGMDSSGFPHLWHALCRVMMAVDVEQREGLVTNLDMQERERSK